MVCVLPVLSYRFTYFVFDFLDLALDASGGLVVGFCVVVGCGEVCLGGCGEVCLGGCGCFLKDVSGKKIIFRFVLTFDIFRIKVIE